MTEKKQKTVKDLDQPRDGESFISYGNRVVNKLDQLAKDLERLIAQGRRQ